MDLLVDCLFDTSGILGDSFPASAGIPGFFSWPSPHLARDHTNLYFGLCCHACVPVSWGFDQGVKVINGQERTDSNESLSDQVPVTYSETLALPNRIRYPAKGHFIKLKALRLPDSIDHSAHREDSFE